MPTMTICVTVDWEGMSLETVNLDAMTAFRNTFPEIPLTHFICPGYLTRGGDVAKLSGLIRGQVLKSDEVALHVHCWQTLLTAAGVTPVLQPSWYINGSPGPEVPYGNNQIDRGHGVPLGHYTSAQIQKIIAYSNRLLVSNGIASATPVSFRCGGWMSADPVQDALQAQTIANDSSSTDAPYFAQIDTDLRRLNCGLATWLDQLWGKTARQQPTYLANTQSHGVQPTGGTATTQPYVISSVTQIPDNGVLADYLTTQMMYERLHQAWRRAAEADVVHICGFHQESATWKNIYDGELPNLANLTNALTRFLRDVGLVADAVTRDEIASDRTITAPASVPKATGNRKVVFNTDRGISKRLPGVALKQISLGAMHRQQRHDDLAIASSPDATKRFWG